jgi:hypothetical protein
MTDEAKFSEVVEAVRLAVLDDESQPVEFDHTLIGRVEGALSLDFSKGDWLARKNRDRFVSQIQRALGKLVAERAIVKSGRGRGNIRYWSKEGYKAHLVREEEEKAAEAALEDRKAHLMQRTWLLAGDATFYVAHRSQITMSLDTLAALLDLAERAGS